MAKKIVADETPVVRSAILVGNAARRTYAQYEKEIDGAATKGVVRSLIHLDDAADTGKYYRPGDVIEGWSNERIAAMVAARIAEIV